MLSRLLERETQAHSTLGDVASLMGKHSVGEEESAIRDVLAGKSTLEQQVRTIDEVIEGDDVDAFFAQFDMVEEEPPALPELPRQSLYPDDISFLDEALRASFDDVPHADPAAGGVGWMVHANHGIAELIPTKDLKQRLGQLPQNYLQEGRILERLKLATSPQVGNAQLWAARQGKGINETTWPEAHFLGPLHPVLDWASDRALSALGRNQIFVIRGEVEMPTVLLMGTLMNRRGQLVSRVFSTAEFPNANNPAFCLVETREDLGFLTTDTGLKPGTANPGAVADPQRFRPLVPVAVDHAIKAMKVTLDKQQESAEERLVLQRHSCSGEWVAAASVMGESGLVLSASSESGPGPDMVGPVVTGEDEGDEQAADLG
ncbi:helicase [Nocardia seriolae]|nr:helicase [Nocardia seriolae]